MSIRHIQYMDIVPLSLLIQEGEQVVIQFPINLEHRTISSDVQEAPVSVRYEHSGQDSISLYGKKEGFAWIRVTSLVDRAENRYQEYYFHVVVEAEPEE